MKEIIRKKVLEFGADVCGFANINRFQDAPEGFHPNDIFVKCKSVISLGISLPRGLACVEPRLIYGHFNNTTCHEVDKLALRTAYGKTVRGFDTVECNKCRTICPRRFGLKDNQADRLIQESNL